MQISVSRLFPFLSWWPLVNRQSLRADFLAGLTGAVIVLPQGVAFASIAGLPPIYGLYTAMVTPIVAGLFGSSRHLISGPTTAISIVVFSTVSNHAIPGTPEFVKMALTLTLFAGIYQLIFGLARMGSLVNFVSHTVVIGFTAGAAILIATSQLKHVLGIKIPAGHSFTDAWGVVFQNLGHINYKVLSVALLTLVVAVLVKKFLPKLPNLLFGMIAGGILAYYLGGEAAGLKMIGAIPSDLPPFSLPHMNLDILQEIGANAFAVALLGLIEAVSISRAIASRSHQRIDGNQEFIGQGLSNIVGSFFSSYAGSGSFTRSGINYAAGAVTPLSAIFAAVLLLLIILLIAPLMAHLPIAAMGGVIMLVAYNLIDFHHIGKILKVSKHEMVILLITFFSTLFLELEFAIYMGVIASLVLFLSRTSVPDIINLAPDPESPKHAFTNIARKPLQQCPQLKIIRIDNSIYFGSINHIQNSLNRIVDKEGIKHILIVGSSIGFIDIAGAEVLVQEAQRLRAMGGGLYFCKNKKAVMEFLKKAHIIDEIGPENFFAETKDAIAAIYARLDQDRCATCSARIFSECPPEQHEASANKQHGGLPT
ncbi:MAG: SulP family inorganic anion transporter [Gammaproteobacteria bacterium]|jgi:sulfate permease, SulP family